MERLKTLRAQRGLTQKDVAEALGIDRTTYTKYEAGHNEPGIRTLTALAAYFAVSVDYLLGLTDNPHTALPLDSYSLTAALPLESMTQREKDELETFARFLLSKRKK